jgi:Fe2+ transport system protein FeoA
MVCNPSQGTIMNYDNPLFSPLTELFTGERAVLFQFKMPKATVNRLLSLGFTPGVEISMMQNYGQGPLVVNVRGTRVALGRGEASGIFVNRRNL